MTQAPEAKRPRGELDPPASLRRCQPEDAGSRYGQDRSRAPLSTCHFPTQLQPLIPVGIEEDFTSGRKSNGAWVDGIRELHTGSLGDASSQATKEFRIAGP